MPRGGVRTGAGRKPKYGEATKLRRVPESFTAADVTIAIQSRQIIKQLKILIEEWQQEADTAARESKTHKPPRTYDKALKLLSELEGVLSGNEENEFT